MNEPLIVFNPAVMMGKPVIAGTRITVELILEKAAAGESVEQIVAAHPRLTRAAVLAAFAFAAQVLRADTVYPQAPQPVWNLVADEGLDREVVDRLRADGHAVVYIAELSPSITDNQVLDEANGRGALLVTADKDFGELVYRLGRVHGGVVLVRLAGLSPAAKADAVSQLLQDRASELAGAFCVIAPGSIRIRRSNTP